MIQWFKILFALDVLGEALANKILPVLEANPELQRQAEKLITASDAILEQHHKNYNNIKTEGESDKA